MISVVDSSHITVVDDGVSESADQKKAGFLIANQRTTFVLKNENNSSEILTKTSNEHFENSFIGKEEEIRVFSTQSDSAIDVSTLSSTTINNPTYRCCHCSCHRENKLLQTYPERQQLQVSLSLPICRNGSYADPVQILNGNRWLVYQDHPRRERTMVQNDTNVNENDQSDINDTNNVPSASTSDANQISSGRFKALVPSCLQNKKRCSILTLIAFSLIATAFVVYFVSVSNDPQGTLLIENKEHVKASPFNSSFEMFFNQTMYCGSIPSKYLPIRKNFASQPVEIPLSQSKSELNQAQPRIIGGRSTSISKYPWQASLYVEKLTKFRLVCGGSIILKNWLITASHCINVEKNIEKWTAFFGVSDLSKRYIPPAEKRKIRRFISHPNYSKNPNGDDYDVTLLQLDKELVFSRLIQPICLPVQDYIFPDGMPCHVSGWGLTNNKGRLPHPNILQHAQVDIIDVQTCNSSHWLRGYLTKRMMCAGKVEGKRDSCQGDSGGPLSCKLSEKGVFVLAGAVSYGIQCGLAKRPGVYANISFFSDWIWSQIAQVEELI